MSVTLGSLPSWLGVAVAVLLGVGAVLAGFALFSRDQARRACAERLLRTWLPWGGGGGCDAAGDDAGSEVAGTSAVMTKHTPMDKDAASRIQSAADRHPESDSARTGFSERAQSAADRAEHEDDAAGEERDAGPA